MANFNYNIDIEAQRAFFNTNKTKDIDFRIAQLKKLESVLKANQSLMDEAIYKDFKKDSFENYATELALIFHEIKNYIKNIRTWSRRFRVKTDLANIPSKSYIIPEPLGVTLVIGAWNYPYQLSLLPMVAAIAAGNTVIVKPSELSLNSSHAMAKIINENFDVNYLKVIEGGVEETTALLKEKFDKIFYTGSTNVGKIVMKAAAEHLCPVVLELGGKSPSFVFKDANIKISAKRLVWAKFLNGGQTCVAPDYLLLEKGVKEKLMAEMKKQIVEILGDNPINSEAFVRIINPRHFDRLSLLIDKQKVIYGGKTIAEELYIEPTILVNVSFDDLVMQEEIFGPILPMIEFDDLDWAIKQVKDRPKPLALYIFGKNRNAINKILKEVSFGGGAVNDAVMHLTNSSLPFGGVGDSGTGSYHGKYGFDAFTHYKSVLDKSTLFEPSIKYAPYSSFKLKLLKMLLG